MTEEKKTLTIEFAPGAFDQFDGTQEELDELVAEIHRMVESGEIVEHSREISEEEFDELPDDIKLQLARSFIDEDEANNIHQRRLQ